MNRSKSFAQPFGSPAEEVRQRVLRSLGNNSAFYRSTPQIDLSLFCQRFLPQKAAQVCPSFPSLNASVLPSLQSGICSSSKSFGDGERASEG